MKAILVIDAIINFILGVLLLLFPPQIVNWLGVPTSPSAFYPNILGAIFIGISVALIIGAFQKHSSRAGGLGVIGAVAINLCGGTALTMWLLFGQLRLPTKGLILLWALVVALFTISLTELMCFGRTREITMQNEIGDSNDRI